MRQQLLQRLTTVLTVLQKRSAMVALDRRDLNAAWNRAHSALEALPGAQPANRN
jgi:hypothetical protein